MALLQALDEVLSLRRLVVIRVIKSSTQQKVTIITIDGILTSYDNLVINHAKICIDITSKNYSDLNVKNCQFSW